MLKMAKEGKKSVIIVGAGPVGLLTALRLGKEGIDTLVLEKGDKLMHATRALVYHPMVLGLLETLDVLPKVLEAGYLNTTGVDWRKLDGEKIANMVVEGEEAGKFGGVLMIGQSRMNEIYLEELKKYPCVDVVFGAGCVGVEETPSSVKVMTWQRSDGEQDITYEADYVLASDGSGSSVRRSLCVPFQGYSWPNWKAVSVQIQYDFFKENNWGPISIIIDQVDWSVIVYTGEDAEGKKVAPDRPDQAVWRVVYGEHPDLPQDKDLRLQRATSQVNKYTKKGVPYKVFSVEPYYLQQRCAAQARKGRVCFAGDALHANNPSGGLGLTTGIVDAFCYGNALSRVINDGEPDELLTQCADSRRDAWLNFTSPISEKNFKRDSDQQDPEGIMFSRMFFGGLKNDPNFAAIVKKMHDGILMNTFTRPTDKGEGDKAFAKPNGVNSLDASNGVPALLKSSIPPTGFPGGSPASIPAGLPAGIPEHLKGFLPPGGLPPGLSLNDLPEHITNLIPDHIKKALSGAGQPSPLGDKTSTKPFGESLSGAGTSSHIQPMAKSVPSVGQKAPTGGFRFSM